MQLIYNCIQQFFFHECPRYILLRPRLVNRGQCSWMKISSVDLAIVFPRKRPSSFSLCPRRGGIVGGYTVAGESQDHSSFRPWMGRISEVSLREELLNSAGEFINVRIRISEASFTRQSYTMRGRYREDSPRKTTSLREEWTDVRELIGVDFL